MWLIVFENFNWLTALVYFEGITEIKKEKNKMALGGSLSIEDKMSTSMFLD